MDKLIRLLPMIVIIPMIYLVTQIKDSNESNLKAALVCMLASVSMTSATYIFRGRFQGKTTNPNRFIFIILAVALITFLAFYFGLEYLDAQEAVD